MPSSVTPTAIAVDVAALLVTDARATVRQRPATRTMLAAPGFDLKATPRGIDSADIDVPPPQDFTALPRVTTGAGPDFGPALQLDPPADGRRVAAELMVEAPKQPRRGSPLSALLTLRIDGDEESPPVGVGGGAGVLWNAIPR